MGEQPRPAQRGRTTASRSAFGYPALATSSRWRRVAPGPPGRTVAGCARSSLAAKGTSGWPVRSPPDWASGSPSTNRRHSFLHLDDLASAVALAADQRLDGVYNVAPDGFVAAARAGLSGAAPKLSYPTGWPRWSTRCAGDSTRPQSARHEQLPRSPWMVANDRLRRTAGAPQGDQRTGVRRGTEASGGP